MKRRFRPEGVVGTRGVTHEECLPEAQWATVAASPTILLRGRRSTTTARAASPGMDGDRACSCSTCSIYVHPSFRAHTTGPC